MTIALSPEKLDIAAAYIANSSSIEKTAEALGLPPSVIIDSIKDKQVREYINEIYLDQGYRNRVKLGALIDQVIDAKLEEAMETGIHSGKDLYDWIKLAVEMRNSDIKNSKDVNVNTQVNVNDFGGNLGALMDKLLPKAN